LELLLAVGLTERSPHVLADPIVGGVRAGAAADHLVRFGGEVDVVLRRAFDDGRQRRAFGPRDPGASRREVSIASGADFWGEGGNYVSGKHSSESYKAGAPERSGRAFFRSRCGFRFQRMRPVRRAMTARIVPLASDEASDARVVGTSGERLALVAELSRRMWAITKRPMPTYTRQTMPVRVTTLADQ
jgi:hypothetical protein